MTPRRIIGIICGILGIVAIVVSFVIGFAATHYVLAVLAVILIGVALVLLKP